MNITQNSPENISRQDFFKMVGTGFGAVLLAHCMSGCGESEAAVVAPNATKVDFTININDAAFSALRNKGGFTYNQGVIIARTLDDSFLAVSEACPHQGTRVTFVSGDSSFFCPNHGSTFNSSGVVTKSPAATSLTRYNHTFSNNTGELRIFS